MRYIKKLSGSLCYLSPINLEDYQLYTQWLNDPEVTRCLNLNTMNISLSGEREVLADLATSHNYAVVELETDKLIGNCGLVDWNQIHGTAEAGLFIGEKSFWGKGYGAEALYLLSEYAFRVLNIKSMLLKVFSTNERAISCYEKVGYKQIGRWRNALQYDGKRFDEIFMDCIRSELVQP